MLADFKPHYKADSTLSVFVSEYPLFFLLFPFCHVHQGTEKVVVRFEILVGNANTSVGRAPALSRVLASHLPQIKNDGLQPTSRNLDSKKVGKEAEKKEVRGGRN